MVDKIVELDDNKKYVMLEEQTLDNVKYYFGLRLDENEEPTNHYLFFEETVDGEDIYLLPIEDEQMKGLLLTSFTTGYLDKVYDEV